MKIFYILLILSAILTGSAKNITGYVFDIRGKPINGSLTFSQNSTLYRFPVNSDNGRVQVSLPEIDSRFYNYQPVTFKLFNNYPNPFNNSTSFELASSKSAIGTFNLFDVLGRKVFSQQVYFENGITRFELNGALAAGIYFLQLLTTDGRQVIKLADLNGNFIDHNNLILTKKAFIAFDILKEEHQTLFDYREQNNPVYKIKAEGMTLDGQPVLPFQTMRYFNQPPGNENIATASVVNDTVSAMLVDVLQLQDDFIVYLLDEGLVLDTLYLLSAPSFRSSWQDIHIDQNTIELFGTENIAVKNPEIFSRQNQLIKQLQSAMIINTAAGPDTLLRVTHDTTATPGWFIFGRRVWSVNNQFNPDHGSFLRFIDGSWRLLFGEAQVRETDGWEEMIDHYLSNAVTLFNPLTDQEFNRVQLHKLISIKAGEQRKIDQRGTDYIRTALLFKGNTIQPLK